MAFTNTRPGLGQKRASSALKGNTSNQGKLAITQIGKNPLVSALASNQSVDTTLTENGMITYKSSLNAATDFFFMAAALRKGGRVNQVIDMWKKVWLEDNLLAIKLLFWLRDIRGGAGEKDAFKLILHHLFNIQDQIIFNQIIQYVPEYGSFKDLIRYIEKSEEVRVLFVKALEAKNGLAAKWLGRPSGKHIVQAEFMIAQFNKQRIPMTRKTYRHLLVELTNVVEQQMCAGRWEDIKYESVPSQAMHIYRTAFFKHDPTRFQQVIDKANKGEIKLQAGAIFPGDLVAKLRINPSYYNFHPTNTKQELDAINAQWLGLPNWMENQSTSMIVAADVSGSMVSARVLPHALALAIYVAQHQEGPFRNTFMTYSDNSKFFQFKEGESLSDIVSQVTEDNMGTDLRSVFFRILEVAKANSIKDEDMPKSVVIISDMEFNQWRDQSALEMAQQDYKKAGYTMPQLVFWNMASRHDNVPARANETNVALVSGYSPAIMKSVLQAKAQATPREIMLDTINSERYARITI